MKITFLSCVLLALSWATLFAGPKVEYKTRPLADKLADGNVRFLATFDRRHINADKAAGYGKALSSSDISLELRGVMGFDQGAAYIPLPNEELAYLLKDNLDMTEGALSFWFRCDDFDPADAKLKKNIGIFNVEIPLKNGRFNCFAYMFGGQFFIASRFFDLDSRSIGIPVSAKIPGDKIGKGVWNQIVWSFDKENKHQFFFNGEPLNRPTLLVIPPQIDDFKVNRSSFMAFSCRVWNEGLRAHVVAIDDITVYDQAQSVTNVQARYQSILKTRTKDVKLLVLGFDGKERGTDKVPLLRCKVDATAMDKQPASASYVLKEGARSVKSGAIELKNGLGEVLFEVPAQSRHYTFEVTAGGKKEILPVTTPDFTFIGKYPRRDVVPAPWTKPVYNPKERTYKVWNRTYHLGNGPFPQQIVTDAGVKVLEAPPRLCMDGTAVTWNAPKVATGESYVTFTGTGTGKDKTRLTYEMRLDFDGTMKVDFALLDKVKVNSMTLEWQVSPALRKHLMTPNYQKPVPGNVYHFSYPQGTIFRTPCLLWSVSEAAGFCWMPEDDANWIHSGNNDAYNYDLNTGKALVKLIAKPVEVPAGVTYNSYFAATPTRPAPENIRGNYGKHCITNWWGTRHNAGMEPDPMLCPSYIGIMGKDSFGPYGMGHGQVLTNPMAQYMEKDWDAPGCFIYAMSARDVDEVHKLYKPLKESYRIANSNPCPSLNTLFNEWQVSQAEKLLASPWGDRVSTLYYDLGAPCFFCGNEIHGCARKDKFNRNIRPTQLTGFRDQYIRMLDVARKYNTHIMSHAQDQFIPFVNGLTDWWLPGEQCSAILRQNKYAYAEQMRPYFETEMNRKVLGTGVMFYTWSIGSANRDYVRTSEVTELTMAMMMLYDIDYLNPSEHTGFNYRVWDTFKEYGIHDPSVKVHRYDTQKEILFNNPKIECTWYECPGGYKLADIVNTTASPITVQVDVTRFNLADGTVYDEYRNQPYQLRKGLFTVTVPARNFVLMGLPSKKRFPAKDDFKWQWKRVLGNRLSATGTPVIGIPTNDFGIVRSKPSALGVWPIHGDFVGINGEGGANFSPAKFFSLRGKTSVTASVWCRSINAAKTAKVRMSIIALDKDNKPVSELLTVNATGKHAQDWERLELTLPETPNAVWLHVILHGSAGGRNGRIVFDDFTLE